MIKQYSLKLLEQAINHGLSLDESINEKLVSLSGKIIELIISPLDVNFFIIFTNTGLTLQETVNTPADTIIHSSPLGLIRLSLLPVSKARSLFNDQVQLSGDIELGEQAKRLFNELDIDWEGHLARFTGDVVAYQLGSWVRQGLAFQDQLKRSVQRNITEYVQEELRIVPGREETDDFFHDVDRLTLDVERLEAQVKLLADRHEII